MELPELPPAVAYLWQWFITELQNGQRLTWAEISAWSNVCKKDVTETEAKALRKLSFIQHRINSTPPK